ncbi:hypothetical protein PQX77_015942 [Marasmius sp. AFHP31]|nr:hypothetical protein PQX77_015942 [Marasmius sp. AFHP31]
MATFALWWCFRDHVGEHESKSSPQSFLQRMLVFFVNRGVLLSANQLLTAFTFFNHPEKLYWAPFHQMLAPLYFITLMATLNARTKMRLKKDILLHSQTNVFGASTYHGENDVQPVSYAHDMRRRQASVAVTPFPPPIRRPTLPVVNSQTVIRDDVPHDKKGLEKGKEKTRSDEPWSRPRAPEKDDDAGLPAKQENTPRAIDSFNTRAQNLDVQDMQTRPHPNFLVTNRVDSDKQSTSSAGYYDPYTTSEFGTTDKTSSGTESDDSESCSDSRSTLLGSRRTSTLLPPTARAPLPLQPLRHRDQASLEPAMSGQNAQPPRRLPAVPKRFQTS